MINKKEFINIYLKLIALITLILGANLLLFPNFVVSIFFNDTNTTSDFFAQITGCTLIGYASLNYIASKYRHFDVLQAAIWGNLATLLVATIVSIMYFNDFDDFAWLIIIQHVIFSGGFVYCYRLLYNIHNVKSGK